MEAGAGAQAPPSNCRAVHVYALQLHVTRMSPCLCSAAEMFSTVTEVKGVASPSLPTSAATLLIRHSTRCPMVIRLGMACGLMMMSGTMPSDVHCARATG